STASSLCAGTMSEIIGSGSLLEPQIAGVGNAPWDVVTVLKRDLLSSSRVQLDLPFLRSTPEPPVCVPGRGRTRQPDLDPASIDFVRVPRARRYILRVRPDGRLRVTVPRGGSRAEARRFVHTHVDWIR